MIEIVITLLIIFNLPIFLVSLLDRQNTGLYYGESHGHRLHRRVRE